MNIHSFIHLFYFRQLRSIDIHITHTMNMNMHLIFFYITFSCWLQPICICEYAANLTWLSLILVCHDCFVCRFEIYQRSRSDDDIPKPIIIIILTKLCVPWKQKCCTLSFLVLLIKILEKYENGSKGQRSLSAVTRI